MAAPDHSAAASQGETPREGSDANPNEPAGKAPHGKPGKLKTWWHPLFASVLRWQLAGSYELEEDVSDGQLPLRLDILLLRREGGEVSLRARQILGGIVERLGETTLIEFKSPSDDLAAGDWQKLVAYFSLYCVQTEPLRPAEGLHLLLVAPRLTQPFREELQLRGVTARSVETGVWHLEGGAAVHPTWLLETQSLADSSHPLLTFMSPEVLKGGESVYKKLHQSGYHEFMAYLTQQIQQFRREGRSFAMQHVGAETEMPQTLKGLLELFTPEERLDGLSDEALLRRLTPEARMRGLPAEERVRGLPAEERVRGLPVEDRLRGLPVEDRLQGLTPEQRSQLLKRLLEDPDVQN